MKTLLNIGLIGFGYWGPKLARNILEHPSLHLDVIVDLSDKNRSSAKKNYPNITITNDANVIFDDSTIDAIVICSPASTHFDLCKLALESGKHCLVTKPFVLQSFQAEQLDKISKENNLVLQIDHTFLYSSEVKIISELIESNELGKLLYIESNRTGFGIFKTDVSVLEDMSTHDLALLYHFVKQEPRRISCNLIKSFQELNENSCFIRVEYDNQFYAHIKSQWYSPLKQRQFIIVGDKKMLVWDDAKTGSTLSLFDTFISVDSDCKLYGRSPLTYHQGVEKPLIVNKSETLYSEINDFYRCIVEKGVPISDVECGKWVTKLVEASRISSKQHGMPVPVPVPVQVGTLCTPAGSGDNYSTLIHNAIADKKSRKYDSVLSSIIPALSDNPLMFNTPSIWKELFNSPLNFEFDGEDEQYYNYSVTLLSCFVTSLAKYSIDKIRPVAQAFIKGALFRHTTHNQRNLIDLMKLRSKLYQWVCSGFSVSMDYSFNKNDRDGSSLQVAVLFKHLNNDPELTSVLPFFLDLQNKNCNLIVVLQSDDLNNSIYSYISSLSSKVVFLPNNLEHAIQSIRELDLDLLVFGNDITAKPSFFSYLSFFKIARKMACCVSTLVTTASPQMDYYFGSSFHQIAGCQSEFTEKFITFPNPGYSFWVPDEKSQIYDFNRRDLGLTEKSIALVSGANYTKLHACLIQTWMRILQRIPKAALFLYPFPPHFGPKRKDAIQRIMNFASKYHVDCSRIKILDPLPGRSSVISFLRQMDVGLDSFPYTGVTTIVESVEARLPTVTLRGSTLRTSQGAAILDYVSINETIVENVEEYVDQVGKLAIDVNYREYIKRKLQDVSSEFMDCFSFSKDASTIIFNLLN